LPYRLVVFDQKDSNPVGVHRLQLARSFYNHSRWWAMRQIDRKRRSLPKRALDVQLAAGLLREPKYLTET
jgi:hypothetical protein